MYRTFFFTFNIIQLVAVLLKQKQLNQVPRFKTPTSSLILQFNRVKLYFVLYRTCINKKLEDRTLKKAQNWLKIKKNILILRKKILGGSRRLPLPRLPHTRHMVQIVKNSYENNFTITKAIRIYHAMINSKADVCHGTYHRLSSIFY